MVFLVDNESREEEFVGIAYTEAAAKKFADKYDSATATCWTEEVRIGDWKGKISADRHPSTVFLVFHGGMAQDDKSPRTDEFDPEILDAFQFEENAKAYAKHEMENEPMYCKPYHIWKLPISWEE